MKYIKPDRNQVNRIIDIVCEETGISKDLLMSKDRHNNVATARFIIYYIMHEFLGIGYHTTGKLLGRTHRAVMWGVDTVKLWSPSNRFRDNTAISNQELFERIMQKLNINGEAERK